MNGHLNGRESTRENIHIGNIQAGDQPSVGDLLSLKGPNLVQGVRRFLGEVEFTIGGNANLTAYFDPDKIYIAEASEHGQVLFEGALLLNNEDIVTCQFTVDKDGALHMIAPDVYARHTLNGFVNDVEWTLRTFGDVGGRPAIATQVDQHTSYGATTGAVPATASV